MLQNPRRQRHRGRLGSIQGGGHEQADDCRNAFAADRFRSFVADAQSLVAVAAREPVLDSGTAVVRDLIWKGNLSASVIADTVPLTDPFAGIADDVRRPLGLMSRP